MDLNQTANLNIARCLRYLKGERTSGRKKQERKQQYPHKINHKT
jgi:hypothetical protein